MPKYKAYSTTFTNSSVEFEGSGYIPFENGEVVYITKYDVMHYGQGESHNDGFYATLQSGHPSISFLKYSTSGGDLLEMSSVTNNFWGLKEYLGEGTPVTWRIYDLERDSYEPIDFGHGVSTAEEEVASKYPLIVELEYSNGTWVYTEGYTLLQENRTTSFNVHSMFAKEEEETLSFPIMDGGHFPLPNGDTLILNPADDSNGSDDLTITWQLENGKECWMCIDYNEDDWFQSGCYTFYELGLSTSNIRQMRLYTFNNYEWHTEHGFTEEDIIKKEELLLTIDVSNGNWVAPSYFTRSNLMEVIADDYYKISKNDSTNLVYSVDTENNVITVHIENPSDYTLYNIQEGRLWVGIDVRNMMYSHGDSKKYDKGTNHDRGTRYHYHKRWVVSTSFSSPVKVSNVEDAIEISYHPEIISSLDGYDSLNGLVSRWANPDRSTMFTSIRPILLYTPKEVDSSQNPLWCTHPRMYAPSKNLTTITAEWKH